MTMDPSSLLIVEDDDALRTQLVRAFRARGWQVEEAFNTDSAVAILQIAKVRFALVDLRLGADSGLAVIREILQHDAETRVLLLTGYGSIESAVDAMRLGASGYLTKPADLDDILAAFSRAGSPPLLATAATHEPPTLARVEWEHINRVLGDSCGNVSEAARRLGVHRRSLQRKLQRYAPR
jgi:two-component system, response regulator RegA